MIEDKKDKQKELTIVTVTMMEFKEDMKSVEESSKQNPEQYDEYMEIMERFGKLEILRQNGCYVGHEMKVELYNLTRFAIEKGYVERDGSILKVRIPFSINDYDLLVA